MSIDNKTVSYSNMVNTKYFSLMKYHPATASDMLDFTSMFIGLNFFDGKKIDRICNFYDATALQLDSFFVVLRSTGNDYNIMENNITKVATETFGVFNNFPPNIHNFFIKNDFFAVFTSYILGEMDYETNCHNFCKIVFKSFVAETNYFQCMNNSKDTNQLRLEKKQCQLIRERLMNFFQTNIDDTQIYINILHQEINAEINKLTSIGNNILDLCSKQILTDNDQGILESFLKENNKYVPDFESDEILIGYYQFVIDNENAAVTINPTTTNPTTNPTIHTINNTITTANSKLATFGYEIVYNNCGWIHTLQDCFVEHGFAVDSTSVAKIVYYVLMTERDTPGYLNKYDDMTTYDRFTLVSIANDSEISYDTFVYKIEQLGKIPYEFPVEILLQLLSRYYDINIFLFTEGQIININNVLDNKNPKHINVYRYSYDSYYNVIPIGSQFTKACENKKPVPLINLGINPNMNYLAQQVDNVVVNDMNDIVEI